MIHLLGSHNNDLSSVHSTEETLLAHISFTINISSLSTTLPNNNFGNQNAAEEILEPLSSTKTARALLLLDDNKSDSTPAGMAIYYHTFSTWTGKPGLYLEDLFVRPEYRGKGYGKALLQRLAQLVSFSSSHPLIFSMLLYSFLLAFLFFTVYVSASQTMSKNEGVNTLD